MNIDKALKGPLAQRLEQGTHNPLAVGSNPTRPTSLWKDDNSAYG